MKQIMTFILALLLAGNALAVEVAGVHIPSEVEVAGEKLQLNGYGIRKKFVFVKVYVGSLFTSEKADTAGKVIAMEGSKMIRMDFLYSKVEKKKIVDAFAEGFAKNSPGLVATPEARQFLALFKNDFVEGDQVDLVLSASGNVSASQNGNLLGIINSEELAEGILLIYLGEQPADADMKEGMLGH